ncbi:hypothetical protein [Azospirillum griseum]|uniref:hypothetical protein n=1 Tax=Azospirillum griseum TaxID=2496639 RepID=UPI0013156036|nr:hypothetical protein [Azospirillum griseum]
MQQETSPSHRLEHFNRLRKAIEAQFATGKISIADRQKRLIAARDATGITTLRTSERQPLPRALSEKSEHRRRQSSNHQQYAHKTTSAPPAGACPNG